MSIGATEVFLLISGLILGGEALARIPKAGDSLKKMGNWLSGFGVFIGIIDIVLFFLALL